MPLKSRQGKGKENAFSACHTKLTWYADTVKLFDLDNECSNDLKLVIFNTNLKFELVPPHQHPEMLLKRLLELEKNC